MKVIKLYGNRKMYDAESSSYISLLQVINMVRNDVNFQVIHNDTEKDVTQKVLKSALLKIDLPFEDILTIIKKSPKTA
jgi:polyhydroxyalkanoate synthesis regulator protein